MNMKTHPIGFAGLCLTVVLLNCAGCKSRPPHVPPTSVRVDKTFVECSAETSSKGNHCTIYQEATGEILADGLFWTTGTHAAVDKSELQYATVGHGMIFL